MFRKNRKGVAAGSGPSQAEGLEPRTLLSAVVFQSPQTLATVANSASVVTADVNGDGKPDIVFLTHSTGDQATIGEVGVMLGNGDGTFQAPTFYPTATWEPTAIAVADVNGDHKPDLIISGNNVGDGSPTYLSLLLGNGDGTFQPAQSIAVGSSESDVAVADLNGDGKMDLVVVTNPFPTGNGAIDVLLGNGDGTFQSPLSYSVGKDAASVAVADVNGDGNLDLVVANSGDQTIGLLMGNGDGTFQSERTYTVDYEPESVAVADVNGDGKPDLIVTTSGFLPPSPVGNVSVLLGNGDGTFQAPQTYAAGIGPLSVVVADLNGDGKPDLVVTDYGLDDDYGDTVSVLVGNGDGTFQAAQSFITTDQPGSVAVADFNGDGKADLVVAGNELSLLLGGVASTTTVSTASAPTTAGDEVVLSAGVTGDQSTPTGTVQFFQDGVALGAPVELSGAMAELTTTSLAIGDDAITARYSGDSTYSASTSQPLTHFVNPFTDVSAVLGATVPSTVIAGTKLRIKGPLTLHAGATAVHGNANTRILLSPDESAADSVFTFDDRNETVNLRAGRSKNFPLQVSKSIPAAVSAGIYRVLIELTDTVGVVSTTDSGQSLVVVAPVVDLTASFVKPPTTVRAGKAFRAMVLVTNTSEANVPAIGLSFVALYNSPDGQLADATFVTELHRFFNLPPGKSKRISFTDSITASTNLLADVDPNNAVFPNDINPANNIVTTPVNLFVPQVDITGSFLHVPTSVSPASPFKVVFLVSNSTAANVAAIGLLPYEVETSPDGLTSDAVPLLFGSKQINLPPGGMTRVTVTLSIDSPVFLMVNLDPDQSAFPNDIDPANNILNWPNAIQIG